MLWWVKIYSTGQNIFRNTTEAYNEAQNRFDIIKIKYIFIDFHNVLQQKAHKKNNFFSSVAPVEKYLIILLEIKINR